MENSTRQQLEGKLHEDRGAAKEKAGLVLDDKELQAEGEKEKIAGLVQRKLGEIEKVFGK
jgi:uncharacterized protein YjbJ (UPF0337 family)